MKQKSTLFVIFLLLMSLSFAQSSRSAYLKSAVLPGWGEQSLGSSTFYYSMAAEAILWLGYGGLRYSYSHNTDNMINYAKVNANVGDFPQDAKYWADLGNYIDYAKHVEEMQENRTTENIWDLGFAWDWNSSDSQETYSELHRRTQLTNVGSQLVIAGLVVNRIVSIINVHYLSKTGVEASSSVVNIPGGAQLNMGLTF